MQAIDYARSVRRTLGLLENDTTALPASVALDAVNRAIKTVAAEAEWSWLYKTTTGTLTVDDNLVTGPADYVRAISFTVEGYPLTERPLASLSEGEDSADPVYFARAGTDFRLWPTPALADNYSLTYYRSETPLVADADAPAVPDAYSPWVVALAALLLPIRTNSPAKYEILREEVTGWRQRALADQRRERNAAPHAIRRTRPTIWQQV